MARGAAWLFFFMEIFIGFAASNPAHRLAIPGDKHPVILGKTGTGKSTILKKMIVEKIRAGEGVTVLDPHGQLVDDLSHFIPKWRLKDLIWWDPYDDPVIGLNFF